ncbi:MULTISPECIES: FecR family protein [Sphingobacterium]|uniref:FecR family protein n=1 Tax=Sphingobacterium TaxID=28453 RepID=UPI0013D930C3|nr:MULTISPECIES: FecR domain-containing protein [unclassified Sphingobacterium]
MDRYSHHIAQILVTAHFSEWTAQEKALIRDWLSEDERNQEVLDAVLRKEDVSKDLKLLQSFDTAHAWDKHKALIAIGSHPEIRSNTYNKKFIFYLAASIAVVVGMVFFSIQKRVTDQEHSMTSIHPGANQATLKLADGTVVPLSTGEDGVLMDNGLTYEDGVKVAGVENINFSSFEITTPRGGQYRMTLPDGSKVWLNADTRLAYREDTYERVVDMDGEAYFEVKRKLKSDKNPNGELKPFYVKTSKQEIAVLGTHFNVKSYKEDAKSYTTLVEGAVRVRTDKKELMLIPGEQGVVQNNSLDKTPVDVSTVLAWKEGSFVFNSERLDEILKQVGRWYDVDFIIEDNKLKGERFEAMVPRFGQLEELLDLLRKTGKIKFKYDDRKVYVSEK